MTKVTDMAGKRRNFYARRITGDFMQNTVTCVTKGTVGTGETLFCRNFYVRRNIRDFMQNPVPSVPLVPNNADGRDPWDDFLNESEQRSAGVGLPALVKIRPERR